MGGSDAGRGVMGRDAGRGVMRTLVLLVLMAAAPSVQAASCSDDTVRMRLGNGSSARFSVEVADDPAGRAKGLMFREHLAPAEGMLFLYERPQPARFWMKNTLIPLDMIFTDVTGTVTRVHANAIPRDETAIDGGAGVFAVLEINGGLAARMGIAPGAVLHHPGFATETAAWPCD